MDGLSCPHCVVGILCTVPVTELYRANKSEGKNCTLQDVDGSMHGSAQETRLLEGLVRIPWRRERNGGALAHEVLTNSEASRGLSKSLSLEGCLNWWKESSGELQKSSHWSPSWTPGPNGRLSLSLPPLVLYCISYS
jgi:hypothetical protein